MTVQWYDPTPDIEAELTSRVTKGVIFLRDKVREMISVPAPRKRVFSPKKKTFYYRATTRATPGAPPRKVSGTLRQRQFFEVENVGGRIIGRVGTNVIYSRRLEFSDHYYLMRTLEQNRAGLEAILGSEVNATVRT